MEVVLEGRAALWEMPAADQALALSTLLSCFMAQGNSRGNVGSLHVRVGGPAADAPRSSSAVYRGGY